jgi:hypothetical protein
MREFFFCLPCVKCFEGGNVHHQLTARTIVDKVAPAVPPAAAATTEEAATALFAAFVKALTAMILTSSCFREMWIYR